MGDSLQDFIARAQGNSGSMPSSDGSGVGVSSSSGSAMSGDSGMDENIKRTLEQNLKPKSSITPLKMNPKMGQSSLGTDVGMSLLNMFVPQIGGTLQKHIKQQKESQINQVVNDFTTLHNAWDEAQQMAGGDEEKAKQMFGQDPRVSALFSDKKKIKLLSKAFGVDLMNPEKTMNNVGFQGLQRFLKIKDAKGKADSVRQMMEQAKAKSAQGGQTQQGQASQGQAQQPEAKPEELAQNFLKMWPKDVRKPTMADAHTAAQTEKELVLKSLEGEPKTEYQAWYKGFQAEEGRRPTGSEVEAHHEAMKLKPVDALIGEAIDDIQAGYVQDGQDKLKLAHDVTQATHPVGHKNFIDLIQGANAGNAEDAKNLKTYMGLQDEMREAYGRGRARYQYNAYAMADGTIRPMSGLDMADWIRSHPNDALPIPSGRLTSAQEISIQQLNTEAGPSGSSTYKTGALKGVYDNISAFDNAKDRAIFANAMNKVEHTSDWLATMKNALSQVEIKNLSPEGQQLYVNLQRLSETMGRFRSSMGLPSTDQSMSLSLALLPGPATPSSEIAKRMLDNLDTMIKQATVPALGGKPSKPQKELTTEEKIKNLKKALTQSDGR